MMFTISVPTTKEIPVKVLSLTWCGGVTMNQLQKLKCSGCHKPIGKRRFAVAFIEDTSGKRSLRLCESCGEKAEQAEVQQ